MYLPFPVKQNNRPSLQRYRSLRESRRASLPDGGKGHLLLLLLPSLLVLLLLVLLLLISLLLLLVVPLVLLAAVPASGTAPSSSSSGAREATGEGDLLRAPSSPSFPSLLEPCQSPQLGPQLVQTPRN